MPRLLSFSASLCVFVTAIVPTPTEAQTVMIGGATFSNNGLVGVGRVPAGQRDKFGETFGSLSGLALDLRTWQRNAAGVYSGTLYTQPDRGITKSGAATNYRPRRHTVALTFTPASNGSSKQTQAVLSLADTTLYTEVGGTPLTGLDPTITGSGVRAGFPPLPQALNGRISLDAEGIALLSDGTFFVCDEYGPYIYHFGADGTLLGAIRPPEAFIPKRNGQDSFSANNAAIGQPSPSPSQPTSGRENNKGFEGLSLSADGRTLYVLMQSATRQDGGAGSAAQNRFTRLLAYDITNPAVGRLTGEWVLPLPLYTDSNKIQQAAESHELATLSNRQFLVVAHDSAGRGASTNTSVFRAVLIYDIGNATNIAGTAVDNAATPLAQNGVLANNIVPATFTVLVDMNDPAQLVKFGLNNGPTDNSNTLPEKWESLVLAPALDPAAPNDFFLLIGNDNDFQTNDGFQDGIAFSVTPNVDSMVLIYRLSLPGLSTAPSIVTQPANRTVGVGQPATFTVATSGNPAPTFQWRKNGVNLAGETGASLSIRSAQASDVGAYTVLISNANGSVTSALAMLTLASPNAPTFVSSPSPQVVATGSTVVFVATASYAPTYQWQRDGVALVNSTGRMLVISNASAADVGSYTVIATNAFGSVTSTAASLTVVNVASADIGRLINLSILTGLAANETMTMGTVLGGAGTSGTKPLLARAAGPALAQFGITDFLPKPTMTLVNTSTNTTVAANSDWGGSTALSNAFAQAGAFAYTSPTSRDAAIFISALPAGNYTAQVSGVGGVTGTVIAEFYDTTAASAITAATPRLINVSTLKEINVGTILTVGFVIGGQTAKTVLVRAIGPRLAQPPFGLAGTMADPQLNLFSGQTVIAANDNWGGDSQLSAASASVGAFAVTDADSKDAMLIVTLAPGNYTVQASGVNNTGGLVIVEVYEVP